MATVVPLFYSTHLIHTVLTSPTIPTCPQAVTTEFTTWLIQSSVNPTTLKFTQGRQSAASLLQLFRLYSVAPANFDL